MPSKISKWEKLTEPRGAKRDTVTKRHVVSWMESRNRRH